MYVSIRSIKIFGIWPHVRTYADRQTYTRVLHCSHASVGLAQARPNQLVPLPFQPHCKSLPSLHGQANCAMFGTFFNWCCFFLRKSDKNIINSHIHKCKTNMCLPYDTLQICALQLCSEAGKSWDVSSSSGRCQSSLDSPAIKVMCVLLCF